MELKFVATRQPDVAASNHARLLERLIAQSS